jgi:hypothetical protein
VTPVQHGNGGGSGDRSGTDGHQHKKGNLGTLASYLKEKKTQPTISGDNFSQLRRISTTRAGLSGRARDLVTRRSLTGC